MVVADFLSHLPEQWHGGGGGGLANGMCHGLSQVVRYVDKRGHGLASVSERQNVCI